MREKAIAPITTTATSKAATVLVVAGIVEVGDRVLICQRKQGGEFPLKWEFPGGKVERSEKPAAALKRELWEELGIHAEIGEVVWCCEHEYSEGPSVSLQFFMVSSFRGDIGKNGFQDVRWARRVELPYYDFLEADGELVRMLSGQALAKRD